MHTNKTWPPRDARQMKTLKLEFVINKENMEQHNISMQLT